MAQSPDPDRLTTAPQPAWVCPNCGEYAAGAKCVCGAVKVVDDDTDELPVLVEPTGGGGQ